MRHLLVVFGLALFVSAAAQAEPTTDRLRTLQQQGLDAYKAGDFAGCAKAFAETLTMRPHHPRLLYNFAACSAKAGNTKNAVDALNEYAGMGLIAGVEKDEDFASLKGNPGFTSALNKFRANGTQIGRSTIAARLTEPMLAEGVAYDAVGRRFFVSSVDERKIAQVDASGRITDFVPPHRDGLLGAFGMSIDAKRDLLWVSMSGVAQARGLTEQEHHSMGVIALSIADGKRVARADIITPDENTVGVIGDLVAAPDGEVFATDSILPKIYSISGPSTEMRLDDWLQSNRFRSLQGVTFSPDGKTLVAADYGMGLHFIDRKTKAIHTIDFAGGTTLLGIDGLTRSGSTLLAVQNGVAPQRVLAISLDASGSNIVAVKVISANDPNIPEPSLGTIKGDEFCVVANAQWSRFNDDGTRKADLDPPHIACIKLH
ncbi:MAG: hypothetical protein GC190_13290 [Alphaproteobacteria bacterium]|nr:hypothetical protein [Alphaproteobacteria bacterium]